MNDKNATANGVEGMLSLARNYAGAGTAEKAQRKFKEIMNMFPNTSFADTAKKELAALEAKKKTK